MGKWKRRRRESDVGREILGNCGEGWAIEGFRRLEWCGWRGEIDVSVLRNQHWKENAVLLLLGVYWMLVNS